MFNRDLHRNRCFEESTSKQREAIGMLHSVVENLDYEFDTDGKTIVFTGDGTDGPCLGYIGPNGSVGWMIEA